MQQKGLTSGKKQIYQLLSLEIIGLCILSIILIIFHNTTAAWSFFVGGLLAVLPNFYQVMILFKENFASAAVRIIRRFYRAELLKFAIIAFFFMVLLRWTQLNVLAFIIGFLCAELGIWIMMPILINIKR